MATTAKVRYETKADKQRQRDVVADMYEGRDVTIEHTEGRYAIVDTLVTGEGFRHLIEVKHRGIADPRYTLSFFKERGYWISMQKITGLTDKAFFKGALPILAVATFDRYLMAIDARRIKDVAGTTTMKRNDRENEYREAAWEIWPRDMAVWPRDIIREYPPSAWNTWTDYGPRRFTT